MFHKIFLISSLLIVLAAITLFTAASTHAAPNFTFTYEETAPQVVLDGWHGVTDSQLSGGTARDTNDTNKTAKFTFTGVSVTWVTRAAPVGGKALIKIDGVNQGIFDTYSAITQYQVQHTFSGLASGKHTLVVKNTGQQNPASAGMWLNVDAFIVGGTMTEDSSPRIKYGVWKGASNANASGGAFRSSASSGKYAGFFFTGTSVHWITAMGPSYGKAEVVIDEVSQGVVDLYSPAQQWQVSKSYSGLSNASHSIAIKVLGQKNAASTGKKVVVDAFTLP